jgi:hypothetical protein
MQESDFFSKILPYLLSGIGGALIMLTYNKISARLQKMHCLIHDEDIISKIPVIAEGESHENIYTKTFHLINTTNKDIKSFKVIFEFDANSKIIKNDTFCKEGKNILRPKLTKPNERTWTIKNFNRKDIIKFYFDIANISKNVINVTESECIGFKIVVKDKRKAKKTENSRIVSKDEIN